MQPFWETKKLEEMNEEEWESLCTGCAKCCYHTYLLGADTISLPCSLLNEETRRCMNYAARSRRVPECNVLSPKKPELFSLLPDTCAYRLLHESKRLPADHPLWKGEALFVFAAPKTAVGEPAGRLPPVADFEPDEPFLPVEENRDNALGLIGQSDQQSARLCDLNVEIRTALNGIMGVAQLLGSTELTDEQQSHIEAILLASAALLKKIDPRFEMSQYGSSLLDSPEVPVNLRFICDQLRKRFRAVAAEKGIEFDCVCSPGVPFYVTVNADWMELVLSNLLEHAFQTTPQGSVKLRIEQLGRASDGVDLGFSVSDTGEGVDPAEQERIFQSYDESGLGVVICRKLIGFMGGTLALSSAVGQGSTFSFRLRLRQSDYAPSFGAVPDRRGGETVRKSNARVLLVEDNEVNQKVALSMLRKAGCSVDVAGDGKAAVRMIQDHPYDVVLMDCQMPLVDGYEATCRIRSMDEPISRIPIIAVTAHAMEGDQRKCLECGMNDYLSKPIVR
ncbi:MAG: response regulator, partial [Pontiellaceae bacterium]|nr:response regulator [Pontiellaceae bacterium]